MLAALESSTSFSVPTRPPSAPSSSSLFLDQSARLSLPDAIHFSEFPECQLLGEFGGFGWWIQGALGLLSFSSLLIKRFRERPRRSWKVFILDSSKQATGAFTIHMLNLIFAALLSWHGTSDPCNWGIGCVCSTPTSEEIGQAGWVPGVRLLRGPAYARPMVAAIVRVAVAGDWHEACHGGANGHPQNGSRSTTNKP
eukprot:GHVT01032492.1.p1 GENE.GHVT01032492.1~~GHVT01032492.1.p1  ORF type:complete len:197 (+),score=27.61 GHVT01032492.1:542-1132(+)